MIIEKSRLAVKKIFLISYKLCFAYAGVESAENVALHKPTIQSSTWSDAVAGRAVDGITQIQNDKSEQGCTATAGRTYKEWWMVNLEKPYAIINITLFNRVSACKNSSLWLKFQYFIIIIYENNNMITF